jgi:carotenoid cleavage dioxygenase-like enzyme
MLHAFTIGDGGVGYANRFLESRDYRHFREHGDRALRGFATDPCRSLFQRVASIFSPDLTDNCNVNVVRLGERWVALTETPIAIEFDPETLGTIGPVKWSDSPGHASAHPHYDFERREAVSYVVRFGPRTTYRVYAVPDGSTERRTVASAPVSRPAYMHSFALTDRYAVLCEQPLVVNPLRLGFGNKPFIENYEWQPERGTRFLVFDRESAELAATVHTDAFFTFHHVNAYEDGGEIVVDLCAYDDPSIIDALYLDRMATAPVARPTLRRFRLPLTGGSVGGEVLSDTPLELPRIAYRTRNGRPYRYVYGNSLEGDGFLDSIAKIDVSDGTSLRWHEPGCFPGEPVFVAEPGGELEDAGVLLSVVLDTRARRSFLLVLDARDLRELARAEAPHRVPLGFHGDFAREVQA